MQTVEIIDLDESVMEVFVIAKNADNKLVSFTQNRHHTTKIIAHVMDLGKSLEQHVKLLSTDETALNDYVSLMSADGYTCAFLELDKDHSDSMILSTKFLY